MADTVVSAPPFVPVKPLVQIGTVGSSVDIACAAEELAVEVDQDENTTETFCGTYTTYKPEVWSVTVTVFPSYGTDGLWEQLRPLVGTVQDFRILPDAGAVASIDNPEMSGKCIVKAFPFYSGRKGEPVSFEVELGVQGAPTFSTTPVAAAAAEEFETVESPA